MQTVAIIQKEIPHYRVPFFTELQRQGKKTGLELTVYTGTPPDSRISGVFRYRVIPARFFSRRIRGPYWMSELTEAIRGSDVIVAPQELQCLNLPYLWAVRRRLCKYWIWWGHGFNFQREVRSQWSSALKEWVKQFMTRRADGIITYTERGAKYWQERGLPEERVIPFFNTLDVEGLRASIQEISEEKLVCIRRRLGLDRKKVLLFSGRLYPEKKVDFLLRAFSHLKKADSEIALLIIGDGPERRSLEVLTSEMALQDVHFLGEIVDPQETGAFFILADLMVIPGLVGLAVVHGFAFGLPLATTQHSFHSPEIEYLSNENGIMTPYEEAAYAREVAGALSTSARLLKLRKGALEKGDELKLARSAERFIAGIRSIAGNM